MRKDLTPIESVMASRLREMGYEFHMQHEFDLVEPTSDGRRKFIFDFFLYKYKIIIETDGKIHCTEENWERDRIRDNTLASMDFIVLHANWNETMMCNGNTSFYDLLSRTSYMVQLRKDMSRGYVLSEEDERNLNKGFVSEIDSIGFGDRAIMSIATLEHLKNKLISYKKSAEMLKSKRNYVPESDQEELIMQMAQMLKEKESYIESLYESTNIQKL